MCRNFWVLKVFYEYRSVDEIVFIRGVKADVFKTFHMNRGDLSRVDNKRKRSRQFLHYFYDDNISSMQSHEQNLKYNRERLSKI